MKTIINNKIIEFNIYNPGGNITALVKNKDYDYDFIKKINDYILDKYKDVEQVGFIKDNELRMAGGEFCINASRCAIYYLNKFNINELKILDKTITGEVNKNVVTIKYSIDKDINSLINNNIVDLGGITLVFLDKETNDKLVKNKDKEYIEKKIKNIKSDSKAIGIVLTNKNEIYPFIWVKDINTLYFETACGSASIAYALTNYLNTNEIDISVKQPSGYNIDIKLNIKKNTLKEIEIKGIVKERRNKNENTKC